MPHEDLIQREQGLSRRLTQGQLTMIAIGGAIGTGLFMGSGIAIGYAGPAVLISYVIAALIAVVMMFSLAEMAVAHPTAGSFGTYAEMYLNRWSGFLIRYTYWAAQSIAIGSEAVAVGHYMNYWFPDIPVWYFTLGFGFAIIYINTRSVANFGSLEYWFSMIKVVAICAFIVFGSASILGIGAPAVGFDNFTSQPGGFMPHGWSGVWMAVLMAIFSFYGVEIIAVTAGEAKDPQKAVPRAMRSLILRLFIFYVLALGIIVAIVPWMNAGTDEVTESPFVKVFSNYGLAWAAGVMNFVVLTAALSSMNANLYLTSRMLFSLSRAGYAPKSLGQLNRKGAPAKAAMASSIGVLIAVITSMYSPTAFNYLFGIALFGGIMVWLMILICHLSFRRAWEQKKGATLPVRSPWFPWPQYLGIALLLAILITMGFDDGFWHTALVVGCAWTVLVSACYLLWGRKLQPLVLPDKS